MLAFAWALLHVTGDYKENESSIKNGERGEDDRTMTFAERSALLKEKNLRSEGGEEFKGEYFARGI